MLNMFFGHIAVKSNEGRVIQIYRMSNFSNVYIGMFNLSIFLMIIFINKVAKDCHLPISE